MIYIIHRFGICSLKLPPVTMSNAMGLDVKGRHYRLERSCKMGWLGVTELREDVRVITEDLMQ